MPKIQDIMSFQLSFIPDQAALRSNASLLQTEVGKALAKTASDFQDNLEEAFATGVASGVKDLDKMQKAFYNASQPLIETLKKSKDIEDEISRLKLQTATSATIAAIKERELRLAGLKVYAEQQNKLMESNLSAEKARMTSAFDKRMKLTQEYNDFAAKDFTEKLEDGADSLGDLLNDAVTLNLKDAFKKGGGMFKKMGMGLEQAGAAKGGKMGDLLGGLGGAVGKLGAVAATIGGVVGGLAALVKVLIDADAQTKEFNRDIVHSVGTLDVMGKAQNDVADSLEGIRKAAIRSTAAFGTPELSAGVKNVMRLGLTTKEYMSTLTKFAETGVTFEKMRDGVTGLAAETDKYTNYVKAASTYSRMFGEDLGGMAEKMGDMMMDLGMNLNEVKEGFATIGDEAQKSGFGTKRFFNMVLQATTGMGQYNIRLSSTAKLLSQMSRILGMKQAGAMFQNIEGKFKGESFQDRTKRILTTGKDFTQKVLTKDAEVMAANFQKALGKLKLDETGMTGGAKEAYKVVQQGSAEEIIKALSTVSAKDRGSLVEALRDKDAKLAERLDKLVQSSGAATGDMMKLAESMQNASGGAKLVLEMNRLKQVIGGNFENMTLQQAMAYGVSVDEFNQMKQMYSAAKGQLSKADQMLAHSKTMEDGSDEQKKYLEEANKTLAESNLEIVDGKVQSAATHKQVMTAEEQMYNWQQEDAKESAKMADQHMAWSEQTAENTYDLTNLVSDSVVSILETISGYVRDIMVFLGFAKDKEDLKKAVLETGKANDAAMAKIDEEIKANREKADQLNKAIASGKLTVGQAEEARAGVAAAKEFERAKRQEKADLRDQTKAASNLARGASDEQIAAFNTISKHTGNAAALSAVGNLTPEQAQQLSNEIASAKAVNQNKKAAEMRSNLTGEAGEGAMIAGALFASSGESEKNAVETVLAGKKTSKSTENTAKNTEDSKKVLDKVLDVTKKQLELSEEESTREDVKEINLALEKAGFDPNTLKSGSKADVAAQLRKLQTDERYKAAELGGKDKKYFQDGLYNPQTGESLNFAQGDILVAAQDKNILTGGSMGGPATVNFYITATEGREKTAANEMLQAFKTLYKVTTGSTRSA